MKKSQKTLKLVENSASSYLHKMASHFNAELVEENDNSTITMDSKKAKGFVSSYPIFSGLSVWVYNLTFFSDFKVDMGVSEDNPYCFCYNVQGHFFHRFGDKEEFAKVHQNQNIIVMSSRETSEQLFFPANIEIKKVVIMLDLKLLGNLDMRNAKRIYTQVGKIFQKTSLLRPYRHLGEIDAETEKYASILCENKGVGLTGGLLTESAAVLNMLALQIEAYSKDITKNKSTLSNSELSKITSLEGYVINNLETSLTIIKLSRHFGISPKKLQIGVKHLYGDSVGHYVLYLRMGHAKHLFSTTDLNVSEVCHLIGISSGSYFSKVFKKRYGELPSYYIN